MEFLFAAAPSPAETAAHSADAVGFQPQTHVVHIAAFLGEQLQRANQDLPQNPQTTAQMMVACSHTTAEMKKCSLREPVR